MRRPLLLPLAALLAACAAPRGMVVAPEPYAAREGARVLRAGGNAVDAAVCVGFVLAVTHPEAGNLGGGGFLLVRTRKDMVAIDARETAPAAAAPDMYLGPDGEVVPEASLVGPLAAGVPGSVAGYLLALERFGTMDRARILEPAIRLAEQGFVVDGGLHRSLQRSAARLRLFRETAQVFVPGGRVPAAGSVLRQPRLARTLRLIAERGRDGFYRGPVARDVAWISRKYGGRLTAEDLAAYRPVVRLPVRGTYRGRTILSMPPPSSGGVVLLQILALIEQVPVRLLSEPDRQHLFVEASRRAFADRAEWFGDPDFVEVPVRRLLDPDYVRSRFRAIDRSRATPSAEVGAGSWGAEAEETCHFSVVDRRGGAVACTTTLNGSYGCGASAAGFLLNNEMDDFTAKPGRPNLYGLVQGERNAIAPGKRPLSSMTPTIVLHDGRPRYVLGSPGGPTIISSVAQVLVRLIDLEQDPARAVAAPRLHHQWLPDAIQHEPLAPELAAELRARGHTLTPRPRPMGDVQLIVVDREGRARGYPDPRGRGRAAW
ncbi:MAG: gamma-glutamyltransferase [Planctomycetota bacterium]